MTSVGICNTSTVLGSKYYVHFCIFDPVYNCLLSRMKSTSQALNLHTIANASQTVSSNSLCLLLTHCLLHLQVLPVWTCLSPSIWRCDYLPERKHQEITSHFANLPTGRELWFKGLLFLTFKPRKDFVSGFILVHIFECFCISHRQEGLSSGSVTVYTWPSEPLPPRDNIKEPKILCGQEID